MADKTSVRRAVLASTQHNTFCRYTTLDLDFTTCTTARLVGAVLAEQHDEWQVARRYFSAESLNKLAPSAPRCPTLQEHSQQCRACHW
jgi:hypothetical protein